MPRFALRILQRDVTSFRRFELKCIASEQGARPHQFKRSDPASSRSSMGVDASRLVTPLGL